MSDREPCPSCGLKYAHLFVFDCGYPSQELEEAAALDASREEEQ